MLIALHEERSELAVAVGDADQTILPVGDLANDLVEKLQPKLGKRFDAIEEKIAAFDSDSRDGSSVDGSGLESLVERFDTIESKLATIEETIQNTDGNAGTDANVEERFEAIDKRLAKVAEAIAGQQQLIEAGSTNPDASMIESFQAQFSEMLSQMKEELATVAAVNANSSLGLDSDSENEEESEPDWNRQKQAMLSKYGIDPEHRPDMAPPTEPDPVLETTLADKELSEELSAAVQLETKAVVSTDPEEIQRIKKELNIKLRDAEVQLSIERAKLSQREAELESKQVELDRRDLELSEKFRGRAKRNGGPEVEQTSLLDRLKKHLTAKDRKNLDRI